jgi:hypothetical protein
MQMVQNNKKIVLMIAMMILLTQNTKKYKTNK